MKLRTSGAVALAFVLGWTACGTEQETLPAGHSGASGSSSAGDAGSTASGGASAGGNAGISVTGGASGSGGSGATSSGGSGGSAGSAGRPPVDASYPDVVFTYDAGAGPGPVTEDSACASVSETAQVERQPVDIIFIVDNSGSMGAEAGQVQSNLNAFSSQIITSGIDVHVVLISAPNTSSNGICIAAPLGSGQCPADTKLPTYLHVAQTVGSTDGLQLILNTYGQWQSSMRANAKKHIVIVTDDNSTLSASSFDTQFKALDASHTGYKFHGIFSYEDPVSSCIALPPRPCCGLSAAKGTVYQELVQLTGGVSGDLCLQDFAPVFNVLASSVIAGTPIQCEFPMPTPTQGVVNPDDVTLQFSLSPTAAAQTWTLVSSSSSCTSTSFYYDQLPNPTQIILCPGACTTAQQASNPTIRVLFGCLGT